MVDSLYGSTRADNVAGSRSIFLTNYQPLHVIGEGGMGAVSLARDVRLDGVWFALKRPSANSAADPNLLDRFRKEAETMCTLSHFHIVRVFEVGEDGDGPFFAMEYVAGPDGEDDTVLPPPPLTLECQVKEQACYDIQQTVQLGIKLCSAVGYAHDRGVIHRDVKPRNILIDRNGEPKLADFGLVRLTGSEDDGQTLAGAPMGTLDYSAPEQLTDASQADERADLYAVGATLWFALTGQSPRYFRESEVVPSLRPILTKALQKDRERRFQSATEFEEALQKLERRSRLGPIHGEGLTPCRCPNCNYEHVLSFEDATGLNFCEGCGESLNEPCLNCSANNKAWTKYCRSCGRDATEQVRTAIERLQTNSERVDMLLREFRFQESIDLLKKDGAITHPRLKAYVEQALLRLTSAELALTEALRQRDLSIEAARGWMTSKEYRAAARLLEALPESQRSTEVEDLLQNARQRIDEIEQLRRELDDHVSCGHYDGLGEKVMRLLDLQPNDQKALNLLPDLSDYEAELERKAWDIAEREGSISSLRSFRERYPSGRHAEEACEQLTPLLRERLLNRPGDLRLRSEYLGMRSDELDRMDQNRAFLGILASYAISGAMGGGIIGIIGAMAGGDWAWLCGGLIGGAIAGSASLVYGRRFRPYAIFGIIATITYVFLASIHFVDATLAWVPMGGFFGILLGAGVGGLLGIICDDGQDKSRIGPIPSTRYASTVEELRREYLGES